MNDTVLITYRIYGIQNKLVLTAYSGYLFFSIPIYTMKQ